MLKEGDKEDQLLMIALAQGKDRALDTLIERHQNRVFSFLARFLQNEADAEDLTLEAFVKVYHNKARFNAQLKFTTWLFQIAANLAKDRIKWRVRHPETSIDTDSGSIFDRADSIDAPDQALSREETADAVKYAVLKLPEELRLPFVLAHYEETSHKEIAEILGCTSKAVETRIYRARQQLRIDLASFLRPEG